ncbi:MAG: response regulator [Rhodobacteraceae bacterium]|nr:response regulator [Paracoccaceae bacterium]
MTIKVLAIDDSRTMRSMLEVALTEAGFAVELAEDGVHGLERLGAVDPDVVITDINMPRMDGFGFIDAVRADGARRDMPILVLTTESAETLKDKARKAGATGWIVKPFDESKLIAAIRRVAPRVA